MLNIFIGTCSVAFALVPPIDPLAVLSSVLHNYVRWLVGQGRTGDLTDHHHLHVIKQPRSGICMEP